VIDDIRKAESIPTGETIPIRPVKPRTTALAAFAALGISGSANDQEITLRRVASPEDMRTKFSSLAAQTIRLKSTASVLYLPDLATASSTRVPKLRLEDTSAHYREFLSGLGWAIDLRSHQGFTGGLDHRVSRSSVYYSDAFHEVMFHVAGMIGDQVELIMRDSTHIVWCEGNFDFSSFGTLIKDGKAFVVIHPLSIGLFSVKIVTAQGIQGRTEFVKNVVVAKRTLPSFVRQVVIGIRIAAIDATTPYQFPPTEVSNELQAIIKTHAQQKNMTSQERQVSFLD
jgi:hypothetical protein